MYEESIQKLLKLDNLSVKIKYPAIIINGITSYEKERITKKYGGESDRFLEINLVNPTVQENDEESEEDKEVDLFEEMLEEEEESEDILDEDVMESLSSGSILDILNSEKENSVADYEDEIDEGSVQDKEEISKEEKDENYVGYEYVNIYSDNLHIGEGEFNYDMYLYLTEIFEREFVYCKSENESVMINYDYMLSNMLSYL